METPVNLINDTLEKVTVILDTAFPDYLTFENCTFTIARGSTQVMIIIRPFNETDTCIECISNVVIGAKITNDLMRFLLRKNAELHFGAFGLLFDDTIIFSHSIAGANVDMNELVTTIHSVAIIADYYDDEIVRMAGGKRAIDVGNSD
ncbi:MAG: YbjN domain-containing protein [Candidatus Kapaibacterium sp.]